MLTFLKENHPQTASKVYAVPIVQYHITHCLEKLCYWLVFSQIITREMMHKKLRLRRKKLVLKIHKNLQIDIGEQWDKKGRKTSLQYSCSTCDYFLYNNWKNCYNYIYICKYLTWEVPSRFKELPYKHSSCIPRWNDVKTNVSTSFQRGIHVECLYISLVLEISGL